MTSTAIPPLGRSVLATGRRVGRHFHAHVLGLAIIRDQLRDGDVMIEGASDEKIVRMRTERQEAVPAPRPRLTAVEIAVALASQDTGPLYFVRPPTTPIPRRPFRPGMARVIMGHPARRPR